MNGFSLIVITALVVPLIGIGAILVAALTGKYLKVRDDSIKSVLIMMLAFCAAATMVGWTALSQIF
ncbi:hypothetical protein XI03_02710 [Bradyrhizobium sp. CCBAU 65884]|nr:hypothetical protein [Bradyrhizobium sp. CCBAU 65884]